MEKRLEILRRFRVEYLQELSEQKIRKILEDEVQVTEDKKMAENMDSSYQDLIETIERTSIEEFFCFKCGEAASSSGPAGIQKKNFKWYCASCEIAGFEMFERCARFIENHKKITLRTVLTGGEEHERIYFYKDFKDTIEMETVVRALKDAFTHEFKLAMRPRLSDVTVSMEPEICRSILESKSNYECPKCHGDQTEDEKEAPKI